MEQEYYIIKRIPWEYDRLPEYYAGLTKFTRNINEIFVFDSIYQARDVINYIKNSSSEDKNYSYTIDMM